MTGQPGRDYAQRNMGRTAIALLAAVVLAGCGGGLTVEEESAVAEARYSISYVVLDGSEYEGAMAGVGRLVAIYREKPDAEYEGMSMRAVLEDAASELDGYQPDMAAELDRALQ